MSMKKFLYVDNSVLPDYFLKVLNARKLLESGSVKSVTKAAEMNGISRSTYYKYKDCVFDEQMMPSAKCATFMLTLTHETGVLSNVLSLFSSLGMSILTISQSLPVNGSASVMLSADISKAECDAEQVLERAKRISGLEQILLLTMS